MFLLCKKNNKKSMFNVSRPEVKVRLNFALLKENHTACVLDIVTEVEFDIKKLQSVLEAWREYFNRYKSSLKKEAIEDWDYVCDSLIHNLRLNLTQEKIFVIHDKKELQGISVAYASGEDSEYFVTTLLTAPWNLHKKNNASLPNRFFSTIEQHACYQNIGSALLAMVIDEARQLPDLNKITLYAGATFDSTVNKYYEDRFFTENQGRHELYQDNFEAFIQKFGVPQKRDESSALTCLNN